MEENNQNQTQPSQNPIVGQTPVTLPVQDSNPEPKLKLLVLIAVVVVVLLLIATASASYLLGVKQKTVAPVPRQMVHQADSTPTPAVSASYVEKTGVPNQKKYVSPKLGLSFVYKYTGWTDQNGQPTGSDMHDPEEVDNKIYIGGTLGKHDGQSVEVFQKSPSDTIEQAITKRFLANVSPNDCFITLDKTSATAKQYPLNYVTAQISFPIPTDAEMNTVGANADKCPKGYVSFGGLSFFVEDINHPDKMLFFDIGQYPIESGNPDTDKKPTWQDTIEFTN